MSPSEVLIKLIDCKETDDRKGFEEVLNSLDIDTLKDLRLIGELLFQFCDEEISRKAKMVNFYEKLKEVNGEDE